MLDRMTGGDEPDGAPDRRRRSGSCAPRRLVQQIYVDDRIKEYVVDLVVRDARARPSRAGRAGAADRVRRLARAPRSSSLRAAKAHAFLQGRGYVTPEDVKAIGARRAAPPGDPHLRGRGRGRSGPDARDPPDPRGACRCHESRRSVTREVRRLEITTRHLVRDVMAGEYSQRVRGPRAWSSPRCASTSRATTSAPSTGTSPPGWARPTSSAISRSAS